MRERWWRWVQWAGGVLVLGFIARFLVRNWAAMRAEPVAWELSAGWILLSLVIVLGTYGLLAESWRRMLQGWGFRIPWLAGTRIWVLSSMGKYLPGKVWAIAGMAALAQRRGVPPWSATASAILLQLVSLGTGALLVGATGITTLELHRPGSRVALGLILVVSSASLVAVLWRPGASWLLVRLGVDPEARHTPSARAVAFGIAANAVAWLLYGFALWCLARGVLPATELSLAEAVGAFAGSYIAGLLFLLAPGGLGVREGVFMWMLQDRLGPANALALAAVSRIGMTAADVLAALPFLVTRAGRTDDAA